MLAFQTQNTTRLLRLTINKACDLVKKDIFGASDPYVQIYREMINNYEAQSPSQKIRKTATIRKTVNPEWHETFEIEVDPQKHELVLDVFDENRMTRDDFLGRVTLPVYTVGDDENRISRQLEKRSERSNVSGSLEFSCYFIDNENPQTDEASGLDPETQFQIDSFYNNILVYHLYPQLDIFTQGQWGRDDFHVQVTVADDDITALEFNNDRGELTIPQSATKEEQAKFILFFFFGTIDIAPGNQNRDWKVFLDLCQHDTDMLDRLRTKVDVRLSKLKTVNLKVQSIEAIDLEPAFLPLFKTLIVPPYQNTNELKGIV